MCHLNFKCKIHSITSSTKCCTVIQYKGNKLAISELFTPFTYDTTTLPVDQYQAEMQMRFINENKVPIAMARGHMLATSRVSQRKSRCNRSP